MQTTKRKWMFTVLGLMAVVAIPAAAFGQEEKAAPAKAAAPAKPAGPVKAAVPVDPTAVLKAIPADATAFVAVRSLAELDADILGLAKELGLPLGPEGLFPGLLDLVKETTGMGEELNAGGSAALVLLSCAEIKSSDEIAAKLVALIPSSDPKALAEAMGDKEGDFWNFEVQGEAFVAADKDGFLVLAKQPDPVKALLRARGDGVIGTMSPDRVKAFGDQDIFGWANPDQISKEIRDEGISTYKGMLTANPMMGAGSAEGATEQIDKWLDESKEFSFGLTVDPKTGLRLSGCFKMKPDTEYARQMAATKVSKEPLLIGLPDEPMVLAVASVEAAGDPFYEKQLRQGLDGFLNEDVVGELIKPEKLKTFKESVVKLLITVERLGFAVSALPAESDEGLVGVTFVAKVTNSQQWRGEVHKLFDLVKGLLIEAAEEGEEATEEELTTAKEAIQWKANAETVAGAKVDHLVVDIEKLPNIDEETTAEVKSVVGKEGILLRVAAVGDDYVVVTFGGGAKRFARIAGHIGKGEAPLSQSKAIKAVAGRLPAGNRLVEGYLGIDRLLTLVMNVGQALERPVPPFLAMKETPPIAFTVTKVDDAAQQFDLLVPVELGKSVMEIPLISMLLMGGAMGGTPMEGTEPSTEPQPAPDSGLK